VCDGLKRPTGLSLCGHGKKRHLHAHRIVSFIYNPEAPFGLESFDLEALDRLMAERKRRGHLLSSYIISHNSMLSVVYIELT